jgi:hypothetical protein
VHKDPVYPGRSGIVTAQEPAGVGPGCGDEVVLGGVGKADQIGQRPSVVHPGVGQYAAAEEIAGDAKVRARRRFAVAVSVEV